MIHTVKGFDIVKTITILVGVKYIVVLVCASQVTDDTERLFICLLATVSPLKKCLSMSFAQL